MIERPYELMRVAISITLTDEEREKLEHWSRGQAVPHRLVVRASIVLLAAKGMMNNALRQNWTATTSPSACGGDVLHSSG